MALIELRSRENGEAAIHIHQRLAALHKVEFDEHVARDPFRHGPAAYAVLRDLAGYTGLELMQRAVAFSGEQFRPDDEGRQELAHGFNDLQRIAEQEWHRVGDIELLSESTEICCNFTAESPFCRCLARRSYERRRHIV